MSRLAIVELHKEELKFSAGHFMLYSPTERESMHGHDYQVHAAFHTRIENNGMAFDCRVYKQKIIALCQMLDYRFILPSQSTYLRLEETPLQWIVHLGTEAIAFFKKDAIVLPICNVTLEELSFWFLQKLTQDQAELKKYGIENITIKVFNGRGESGATSIA